MPKIYGIRALNGSVYIYIGSTKHEVQKRFEEHLYQIKSDIHINKHFARKARKIGLDNLVVDVIEECPEDVRFVREHDLINDYLKNGHPLTNIRLAPWELEARTKYDEYELKPHHMKMIAYAAKHDLLRTGDKLHDLFAEALEQNARHIFNKHFDEFCQQYLEVVGQPYVSEEIDNEEACFH